MIIGYARISKADGSQVLDSQTDAFDAYVDAKTGEKIEKTFVEKASGKNDDRPRLAACLETLREGDTLIVWRLDRLGRNLKHLIEVVEDLNNRKIGFRCLTGLDIDTSTANGRLMFSVFAALAQFERELIVERTKAGLASARARGRVGGRKPVFTKSMLLRAKAAMAEKCNVTELCDELKVSRSAIYYNITKDGAFTEAGKKLYASL